MQADTTNNKQYALEDALAIFSMPFMELLYKAHGVHKKYFPNNTVQASSLLSIKTGKCPEDCSYCSQSAKYSSKQSTMLTKEEILFHATKAKEKGATRFCMGAAGRKPTGDDLDFVCECVSDIKKLGIETCVTLGMLTKEEAHKLKNAGLDYYNHNVDTSPEFYSSIITTRTFEERIQTITHVQEAGIHVCAGGIVGMGETNEDRVKMLTILANLPKAPQSIPINKLVPIPNTPLEKAPPIDPFDFVRTIALARILMPTSYVRLSAGRNTMEESMQALCFFAGANSIFIGEALLTTDNTNIHDDMALLQRLNLQLEE